jgi:hypothetical protein
MNDLASALDEELSLVSCRAIASLAWYDRSNLGRLLHRYCMGIIGTAPQYRTYKKGENGKKRARMENSIISLSD